MPKPQRQTLFCLNITGPTLSNLIARSQLNIGSGTITVYDPRLVISEPKYSNMKLYKEEFKKDIDISSFDLVISIMPCSATEIVLDSVFYGAFRAGADFPRVALHESAYFRAVPPRPALRGGFRRERKQDSPFLRPRVEGEPEL